MNAPKTSHTVPLENPVSAKRSDSSASLKPGFARSAGPNSTQGESTVTAVSPIRPIAGAGSGSVTRPAMTPAKIAKKYHACGSSPFGVGTSASSATMASGTATRHGAVPGDVAASSATDVIVPPAVRPRTSLVTPVCVCRDCVRDSCDRRLRPRSRAFADTGRS